MTERRQRERLDLLLVSRGLAPSRERAQRRIMAGEVRVDGQPVDKAGARIATDAEITLVGDDLRYASRGGLKLEAALDHWAIDVSGWAVVDVGASTGGFTDCVLQRGAARSLAIDVGYGQLAWHIRQDPRVEILERTNIRTLDPGGYREQFDLAIADVSFISLRLVLANIAALVRRGGRLLPLVKPQFEVGRERVGGGGVVRSEEVRLEVVDEIERFALSLGLVSRGSFLCPVPGPKGNREYFLHLVRPV